MRNTKLINHTVSLIPYKANGFRAGNNKIRFWMETQNFKL